MKKTQQMVVGGVIGVLVVGGLSFYGGMKYGENQSSVSVRGGTFADLSPEERQARFQQFGAPGTGSTRAGAARTGGGFVSGEILSKDATSITVKLSDGGSKIVFVSDSTKLSKSSDATSADLSVGETVTASGTTNQDGSVSAQSVQIVSKTNSSSD